jgi:hypothetical protein
MILLNLTFYTAKYLLIKVLRRNFSGTESENKLPWVSEISIFKLKANKLLIKCYFALSLRSKKC